MPLAKEIDEFDFADTPINETLARDLTGGDFLQHRRNVVLIGGTGTGKTHLAVVIGRACIRHGARGRFFNAVDLVNKLDAEARADRQGRLADLLCRLDFLILDELGFPRRSRVPVQRRLTEFGFSSACWRTNAGSKVALRVEIRCGFQNMR